MVTITNNDIIIKLLTNKSLIFNRILIENIILNAMRIPTNIISDIIIDMIAIKTTFIISLKTRRSFPSPTILIIESSFLHFSYIMEVRPL